MAVRIGFDDNRSLGAGETGARVALPVFRDVMTAVYRGQFVGPVPLFPQDLEAGITAYLTGGVPVAPGTASEVHEPARLLPVHVRCRRRRIGYARTPRRAGNPPLFPHRLLAAHVAGGALNPRSAR
ncbi:MAG TPA: hypothetical protein VL173_10355 [Vicinamibacterales bacterium]|nr:hypothetical protein [Vicinamibacterales bacterium]